MLNTYLRTVIFIIDGIEKRSESWLILEEDTEVHLQKQIERQGKTFESLWNCLGEKDIGMLIPGARWYKTFWSNIRTIEFFTKKTKTWIDNGLEREWSLIYYDEPCSASMERLLKFNSEKVAQYLVERGLSIAGAE